MFVFSSYWRLKSNISKFEMVGIGALKGVYVTACGLKTVDLTSDTVKIRVHFSYNKEIQNEKNFRKKFLYIQNILKLWRMRSLTIEGKITIFKTLALSKVVYLALCDSRSQSHNK